MFWRRQKDAGVGGGGSSKAQLLAALARLQLGGSTGGTAAAAGCAAAARPAAGSTGGTGRKATIKLGSWNDHEPGSFYLAHPALEALSDCFADVSGVRLPLHSQVLSGQSGVLRDLFLAQKESTASASSPQDGIDLSAAFQGTRSAQSAACFLRLLYNLDDAHPGNLAELAAAGALSAVAYLAHKLDVGRLLHKIDCYLQDSCARASMQQLAAALRIAQHCQLEQLQEGCLARMAFQLATAGQRWPAIIQQEQLAALDSATLARLLCMTLERVCVSGGGGCGIGIGGIGIGGIGIGVGRASQRAAVHAAQAGQQHPPVLFDVRSGTAGGFTFAIDGFSQRTAERDIYSPWCKVGGFEWAILVHPNGFGRGIGTHLSAYLCLNLNRARDVGVNGVSASFKLVVIEQGLYGWNEEAWFQTCWFRLEGADPEGGGGSGSGGDDGGLTAPVLSRGRECIMPLAELRRGGRRYLVGDRLLVRVDLKVKEVASAPG